MAAQLQTQIQTQSRSGRARTGAVRMGVLNLLVMVIALSLAVLAVLALTTARAGQTLSEREAQTVQEIYACDAAGQRFLAAADAQIALFEDDDSADHILLTMLTAEGNLAQAAQDDQIAAACGVQAQVEALTRYEATDALGERMERAAPLTICALRGTFTAQDGQRLSCLVAINNDRTYTVLQWQQTKVWEDAPGETLLRIDD